MIKGICFDLDGVFFTRAGLVALVKELTEVSGGDETKVKEAILSGNEMIDYKNGKLSEEAFWQSVNIRLGIQWSVQEYRNLYAKHYQIDPNVLSVVKSVRSQGYKTLICSNNYKTRVEVLQEKFNFLALFDVAIFSYQVGISKPDIGIFQKMVEAAELEPNEIVYADDQETKLLGAQSLGIITSVYTTFEKYIEFLKAQGVHL